MRKIFKRREEKKFAVNIFILSVICLFFLSIGYSVLNQDLGINGAATIEYTMQSFPYEVNCTSNKWQSDGNTFYHCEPGELTFLGDEEIYSWEIIVDVPENTELIECYGNTFCEMKDGKLHIYSSEINGKLKPNDKTKIGFLIKTTQDYELIVEKANFYNFQNKNPFEENVSACIPLSLTFENVGWANLLTVSVTNDTDYIIYYWEVKIPLPETFEYTAIYGSDYVITDDYLIFYGLIDQNYGQIVQNITKTGVAQVSNYTEGHNFEIAEAKALIINYSGNSVCGVR